MNKVAISIEKSIKYWKRFRKREYDLRNLDHEFNMNYSVCMSASNIDAKAIIAYTETGSTPRLVSSFGPGCPIFAITQNEIVYRQLGLCWNIIPKLFKHQQSIDELIKLGVETLMNEGFLQEGDTILVAGGSKIVPNLKISEDGLNNVIGGIVRI